MDDRTVEAATHLRRIYEVWHTAEPGKGYDAKAAEWRAKLDALNAEASSGATLQEAPATTKSQPEGGADE
jgi:hypothetical protein